MGGVERGDLGRGGGGRRRRGARGRSAPLNAVLADILRTDTVESVDGTGRLPVIGAVADGEGRFLQELVREIRPTTSLEMRLAFGVSALFICDALPHGPDVRHVAIDPHQNALVDFFYVDRLLRVGGVVVLDDTLYPGLWRLCRFIATNRACAVARCFRPVPVPSGGFRGGGGASLRRSIRRHVRDPSGTLRRLGRVGGDDRLGLRLGSTCVAFRKEADDARTWDHYADF